MLTHNGLANRQGYEGIAAALQRSEFFIKKEDPYIKFFAEVVEPMCQAYEGRRYGEMFAVAGGQTPTIRAYSDKQMWSRDMDTRLYNSG